MATLLDPIFHDYTKFLIQKAIGGYVGFLQPKQYMEIRYIDTTNFDMSVWISNMRIHDGSSPTTFTLDVLLRDYKVIKLWSATTHAIGKDITNGFTIPKQVFDLGSYKLIQDIRVTASNDTAPDNHEFFMWEPTQFISVS
jgi:hypothetical protein